MEIDFSELDDFALAELVARAGVEQQRRALERADLDALVEYGFAERFASSGMPLDPVLVGGVIVCAGAKLDRSATSHDCGFVSVEGSWVWECDDLAADVVRHLAGPKPRMRSVSLVPARESMTLDLVVSRMRTGVHSMRSVRSFEIRAGELVLVESRARSSEGHR